MNKKFKELFSYLAIIAGALIASFSVACILLPNDAIDYGTSGIAIIISKLTGRNLSLCVLIVFLPFLAADIFLLVKHFFAKTFIDFKDPDEIIREIKEDLNKTCTIINSSGVIAGDNKTLICYVNYFELQQIKKIISKNKGTFSTVSTIEEILR